MSRRKLGIALRAVALALVVSAPAEAAYVDQETGSDSTNCGDTIAMACRTVQKGIDEAAQNDTVRVDDSITPYAGEVSLYGRRSLVGEDFVDGDEGTTQIGTLADDTGVRVNFANLAGTVRDLTLVGNGFGLDLDGTTVAVLNNAFPSGVGMFAGAFAGSPLISDNSFTDDGTGTDIAIQVQSSTPTLADNTISDHWIGISALGPTSFTGPITITDNEITGSHEEGTSWGAALNLGDADFTVRRNLIYSPGEGNAVAIDIAGSAGTSAVLSRNTALRHTYGLRVVAQAGETGVPISLDSDVMAENASGIHAEDNVDTPLSLAIDAENVTLVRNTSADIAPTNTAVELDSSVLSNPILTQGQASCSISFSAGATPGGTGECEGFSYPTPPPGTFVDYDGADADAFNDYLLVAGSPMIDAGNPADPPPGELDNSGGPRTIDADGECPIDPRRDVGADEFDATQPNCDAPGGRARRCAGKKVTGAKGTPGNDVLAGTRGPNKIRARAGSDLICGLGARDRLIGGKGKDRLIGGKGADLLRGGAGRDVLLGGPKRDLLVGGPGRDKLRGGPGRDRHHQ